MSTSIVECIPNFSDARRPDVIEAIVQAIKATPAISVLDRHSDLDHNRTVITFVGPPEQVEEAAFQAVSKAAALINLDEHTGEHPRIGATDVLPFVPISGVSMQDCVEMARRVGQRVAAELGIPVYLYEEAATRPERQNLENIRRGQYEGLKVEIATHPERAPDFGPAQLGPAGATVIGARPPLIAFNAYLTTGDVSIAKKIAKAVRNSSGGLRYVKGLGLLVEGRAQVSMNLTNYRATSVARVVEMIRREAERYAVGIHHTELVGLIPQEALVDAAVWYMQLDQFEPEQILEHRLQEQQLQEQQSAQPEVAASGGGQVSGVEVAAGFLEELAAGTAAPGGGSASAFTGAEAAALVAMVARLTVGKKKYAAVAGQMQAVLERAEVLRGNLLEAVERDAKAFEAVMAAFKLPKDTPEQEVRRLKAVEQATVGAAEVPLEVAGMALEVIELAAEAVSLGNLNAISDGATAAALARAALTGASYNVRINIASLQDQSACASLLEKLRQFESHADKLESRVRAEFSGRGGASLA